MKHASMKCRTAYCRSSAAILIYDLRFASIQTTIRFYSGMEQESSAWRFDEVILNRRRTLKNKLGKR